MVKFRPQVAGVGTGAVHDVGVVVIGHGERVPLQILPVVVAPCKLRSRNIETIFEAQKCLL